MKPPRIVLLCATNRGVAFARRLIDLCPEGELMVCSFPEKPWEPPYLANLESVVATAGHRLTKTRHVAATDLFEDGACDLMLAVNWRYLIPPDVYRRARKGAFVFHDSLLPKYRGFSPTVWAMINGETETGVTLFEMAEAVDSGRIVDQESVPIGPHEYIDSVVARVTDAYLRVLERNLAALLAGTAPLRTQNESEATYCARRTPDDNRIDWRAPAVSVFNLIRASSTPYPGAFSFVDGKRLTIWKADPPDPTRHGEHAAPGQIVEHLPGQGVRIMAGDIPLLIRQVQSENDAAVAADQLLQPSSLLT